MVDVRGFNITGSDYPTHRPSGLLLFPHVSTGVVDTVICRYLGRALNGESDGGVAVLRLDQGDQPGRLDQQLSLKDVVLKVSTTLTSECHAAEELDNQALAVLMKWNFVRALIQRGALR